MMENALIVCRTLHYAAGLLVFGTSVFMAELAPPDLTRSLDIALRKWLVAGIAVALATAIGWLGLLSGELVGGWSNVFSPATWFAVMSDTQFGGVWSFHLLLGVALLAVTLLRGPATLRVMTAVAALFLATLGLVGHAVMPQGFEGWFSRASQVVHL